MDKKSKGLIATLFILIIASAVVTYYKYMVLKDYPITASPEESI